MIAMSNRIIVWVMALMMVTPVGAKHKNFKVSVYVRAAEVQKMKDQKWLDESWATISNQLDVDKIYLETHRDLAFSYE